MVQAVAALLLPASLGSTISVFGVTLATASGLTLAGSIVNLGIGLAISAVLRPDVPRLPTPEDIQQNFRTSVGPRLVHLGRVKAGGQLVTIREANGFLYQVLVQGHREIDGIEEHFIDGNLVTLDGTGTVLEDQYVEGATNYLQILSRLGAVPSNYFPEIEVDFPDWDSTHRLDGLYSTLIIATAPPIGNFNSVFPNRSPTYQSVIRGIPLFDPRNNTTVWSENPALAVRDYLVSADGMGIAEADIDDESFSLAADNCDQILATNEGSDSRYRIGGTYRLTDSAQTVIDAISSTCDGQLFFNSEGKFGFRAGTGITPSVTLEQKHLVAVLQWSNGPSTLEAFTTVKPDYIDQELGFIAQPIDPWIDGDLVTRYGREITDQSFGLALVPTHHQARRLSKIHTKKQNPLFTGRLRYNLHGLKAMGEEFINIELNFEGLGVDYSGPVLVDRVSLSGSEAGGEASVSYVDIDVRVLDPETYNWTVAEEGSKPFNPVPDTSAGIPDVANFFAAGNGAGDSGIAAVWDDDSSSLTPVLEFSPAGAETWLAVNLSADSTAAQLIGLSNGAVYDLRIAWESPNGVLGDYSILTNIAASNTTGPPDDPSGFTVTDLGAGQAQIDITSSASANNYRTLVFRDGVEIGAITGGASQAIMFAEIPGAGTYTYTAQSESVAGDLSGLIDSTVTPTIVT